MIVRTAREIARHWLADFADTVPDLQAAYLAGSTAWLPDDAELPVGTDVDLVLVPENPDPPGKPGKLLYQGVLLEVTYLSRDLFRAPERVLANYHLAGGVARGRILLDRSGAFGRLQAAVAAEYPRRRWVVARCEHAQANALRHLSGLKTARPFHEHVTAWLFAAGVTTHVLLVAGLENPTVRRRYAAVRELLAEHGRLDFYQALARLLGSADLTRSQVERHLRALAEVFDATAPRVKSPFFFASDISTQARPVAIDGSRALIEEGLHREAVFWIVATYARCLTILHQDATPELHGRYDPAFRELLHDLGIDGPADLLRRGDEVRSFLPAVWAVAQEIVAANPEILD